MSIARLDSLTRFRGGPLCPDENRRNKVPRPETFTSTFAKKWHYISLILIDGFSTVATRLIKGSERRLVCVIAVIISGDINCYGDLSECLVCARGIAEFLKYS